MRRTYNERRKATYKKCRKRYKLYDSIYNGINNHDTIHKYDIIISESEGMK